MATSLLDREPAPENCAPQTHVTTRAERARINGAKSRGPVTEGGKARSSQNSRKHGLTAKLFLIDPSHEPAYKDFKQGFVNSLVPTNQVEMLLVEDIAQVAWNLRQAHNMETDVLRHNIEHGDSIHSAFTYDPASVMAISLYQSRLDRRFHKLMDQLRKMRKDARNPKRDEHPVEDLFDAITQEKARRGISLKNDQTNPEFELTELSDEPRRPEAPKGSLPKARGGASHGAGSPELGGDRSPHSKLAATPYSITPPLPYSSRPVLLTTR